MTLKIFTLLDMHVRIGLKAVINTVSMVIRDTGNTMKTCRLHAAATCALPTLFLSGTRKFMGNLRHFFPDGSSRFL